jgi:hypothetical protein
MIKYIHYFPIYERHFRKFVNQSVNFWEIGVLWGGSMQMWQRYLGPFAKIIGIDIDPACKNLEENQIKICIGDQSDTAFLQSIIDQYGPPDIVLDDGSHIQENVCASFDFLYDKISKNGVYMVEDLWTSYWDSYGGGLKREGTFVERCKDMIDSLNYRCIQGDKEGHSYKFASSTYSMCFYDSVAVFEKVEWSADGHLLYTSPKKTDVFLYQKNNNRKVLGSELVGKSIVLFGAGKHGAEVNEILRTTRILETNKVHQIYFTDNDKAKYETFIGGVEVISPEESTKLSNVRYILTIIDTDVHRDICNQLKALGISEENIFELVILR